MHSSPGLSVMDGAQVVCAWEVEKSPVKFHPASVIGAELRLFGADRVTICTSLGAPVSTFPNFTLAGP